jgi:hypothetical protein
MNSPLSNSCHGLLSFLLLAALAGYTEARSSPSDSLVPTDEGLPVATITPSGSDLPGGLTAGHGGPSFFSPPDDLLSSGDSGGQDLPPNGGDDDGDDEGEDQGDEEADDDGELAPMSPPSGMLLMQVTLRNPLGVITRRVRLTVDARGNQTLVITETVERAD